MIKQYSVFGFMIGCLKHKGFFLLLSGLFTALLWLPFAHAQDITEAPVVEEEVQPEEFAARARALDGQMLQVGRHTVRLWGIEAVHNAGSGLAIRARAALDDAINDGPVGCRVKDHQDEETLIAQCTNQQNADLALLLLQKGYAVVNRPAVVGTVFETPYHQAEKKASGKKLGLWMGSMDANISLEKLLQADQKAFFWFGFIVFAPVIGFFVLLLFTAMGFGRMNALIRKSMEVSREREDRLRSREKFVVAAMLETELMANRGKLEAFVVIYKDMIKTLRAADKDHKYQQSGDIIHESPSLTRSAYDGNVAKLDLLGAKLAADLVNLYTNIQSDPDYMVLESDMPVEDVLLKLDKIISDAERLMKPIDKILGGLHVILRDEKAGMSLY